MANSLSWIQALTVLTTPNITWWKFNEGLGSTTTDFSGASNTGNLINTPSWVANGGGFAVSFDGVHSQCVTGTNVINIAKVTISAWVNIPSYPSNPQNASGIVGFANGVESSTGDKDLYIDNNGYMYFYIFNGAGITTSKPASPMSTGSYHHVAGTYDGTNLTAYIDGLNVGSASTSGNSYTGYTLPNLIVAGSVAYPKSWYLNGVIDDVRVWDSALSPDQISALNAGGMA